MAIKLRDYQLEAIENLNNGSILNGGVGSGKSVTAIGYYYTENGGEIVEDDWVPMKDPQDLYIITTARKRDTLEWEGDLASVIF